MEGKLPLLLAFVVVMVACGSVNAASICKGFVRRTLAGTAVVAAATFSFPAVADNAAAIANSKLTNLPSAEIAKIVASDITDRQALITADFTRAIYSEGASFQDEIDTYPIDKYVAGTKALFNAAKSHVDLVGPVEASDEEVNFRFQETLAFNVPFIQPKVSLSGRVKLTRGDGGLIVSRCAFGPPGGHMALALYPLTSRHLHPSFLSPPQPGILGPESL